MINSTDDQSGSSSQRGKKRKSIKSMTIEEAKKAKENAVKKRLFDWSNLVRSWENGMKNSQTGQKRWINLHGKKIKAESNARRHDLASRLLSGNAVMRDVLHSRAQELHSVPFKIQERMDKVKSESVRDDSLVPVRINASFKKRKKFNRTITKYDKVIQSQPISSSSSESSSSGSSSSGSSSTASSNDSKDKRRGKRQKT